MNDADEVQSLEDFIVDNDELEKLEDLVAEFNIFEILGMQTRETRHSAFLAWLLDPAGNHGLGDYFSRRFLRLVARGARLDNLSAITAFDVDAWGLGDIVVDRERHNVDILITSEADGFVCAIENKIFSEEHSGQLGRYRTIIEREYPDLRPLYVFLTVDGDRPVEEADAANYVPISYTDIADLLIKVLDSRGSTLGGDVLSAIKQYLMVLRRHVLSNSEVHVLAQKIYRQHKKAIDLIIEARPDVQQSIRDMVEELVQHHPELRPDVSTKSSIRYYDPRWDEHTALLEGSGWTSSGRMLLFEFKNNRNSLRLHLILGPGPDSTRERVYKEAVRSDRTSSKKRFSKVWTDLYSRTVLTQSDFDDPDFEVIRNKVANVVSAFLTAELDNIAKEVDSAMQASGSTS
jgi:hypothetical protein